MVESQITILNITKDDLFELMVEAVQVAKKKEPQPEVKDLLTRKETADLLNVNVATLWRWTNSGKLIQYGIGGRTYYKRSEVLEAVKSLK